MFGFLAFRLADSAGRPHPVLGDVHLRRALAAGTDRATLAHSLIGPDTRVPNGPMSQLLWISDTARTASFDTAAAAVMRESAGGCRPVGRPIRMRAGRPLHFDILVPATSTMRRQVAVALQEAWRRLGADVTVTAVDFPVFQQRLGQGRLDRKSVV